jgi:hypothetical protein
VSRKVFLPINNLVAYKISLSLFEELKEEIFNVLHQFNCQAINSSAIKAIRFSHVVNNMLYLESDLLLETCTDDPELDDSPSHGSVVILDPIHFFLFKYLLLLCFIFKIFRLVAVFAYI